MPTMCVIRHSKHSTHSVILMTKNEFRIILADVGPDSWNQLLMQYGYCSSIITFMIFDTI